MDRKQIIKDGIKSYIVGATMTVPGVSGGSMAMVLGIYDRLVGAVPALFSKNFLSSFLYLFMAGVLGVCGVLTASPLVSMLLENHYDFVMSFFIGVVTGSLPMIVRKCRLTRRNWYFIFFLLFGVAAVFALSYFPMPINGGGGEGTIGGIIAGVFVSIGFVLPGISTTYLLVVMGLYEKVLSCLSSFDFLPLLPLAFGLVLGVVLLTGILKKAMESFPSVTFPVILGFVLGSLPSVFPHLSLSWSLAWEIVIFLLGFSLTFFVLKED